MNVFFPKFLKKSKAADRGKSGFVIKRGCTNGHPEDASLFTLGTLKVGTSVLTCIRNNCLFELRYLFMVFLEGTIDLISLSSLYSFYLVIHYI